MGSRVNDALSLALSVSQILAHNFENVMVTYASIFTGPQAQIPSSPYQQGFKAVARGAAGAARAAPLFQLFFFFFFFVGSLKERKRTNIDVMIHSSHNECL